MVLRFFFIIAAKITCIAAFAQASNLFSSNGNGTNDGFRVRGVGISQIDFRIYDPLGREVFSTADVTEAVETGWDGTRDGDDLPSGIYAWTLRARTRMGSH